MTWQEQALDNTILYGRNCNALTESHEDESLVIETKTMGHVAEPKRGSAMVAGIVLGLADDREKVQR